ncbi:MAG TPA: PAS domain S-box protein, partial [Terriglobales bacterium]|nr:PAS domain S-box protein [Terriglobales bacterium]
EKRTERLQKQIAAAQIAHELAHEINNPLEALVNLLYLLKSSAGSQEELQRHEEAERQLARIATLVRSILAIEHDDQQNHFEFATRLLDPSILSEYKKRYDEALHLAAIVESAQDAIYSKKLDGTILAWNAGAERLFGYSASEALGRSIRILVPRDNADDERMIMERLRNGVRIESYETVRQTKEGNLVKVSVTVSPIFNPSGRVVGASTIARRVSD